MKNIYLIGFMGTGKSTVGTMLAEMLGAKCIEMDDLLEERQRMSIAEIFDTFGESYFRDLETEFLRSLIDEDGVVVSCGGGSVLRDENAAMMKQSGRIILLTASPKTVYERVRHSETRPVLKGHMNVADICNLMEKRRAQYETVADVKVMTDEKSVETICAEILQKLLEVE